MHGNTINAPSYDREDSRRPVRGQDHGSRGVKSVDIDQIGRLSWLRRLTGLRPTSMAATWMSLSGLQAGEEMSPSTRSTR